MTMEFLKTKIEYIFLLSNLAPSLTAISHRTATIHNDDNNGVSSIKFRPRHSPSSTLVRAHRYPYLVAYELRQHVRLLFGYKAGIS